MLRYHMLNEVGADKLSPYEIKIGILSDSRGAITPGIEMVSSFGSWFSCKCPLTENELSKAIEFFDHLDKRKLPVKLHLNSTGYLKLTLVYLHRITNKNRKTVGYNGMLLMKRLFRSTKQKTKLTSKSKNILLTHLCVTREFYKSLQGNRQIKSSR